MAYLEQWFYTNTPESHSPCLRGYIFGHEDFPDGAAVITSPLVAMDPEQGFAMTQNALYALGSSRSESAWEQRALRRGKRWLEKLSTWRFLILPVQSCRKQTSRFQPRRR